MKRVLLTGATGFIGHHCIQPLQMNSYEVHAVSSRKVGAHSSHVHWYQADLLNASEISTLLEKVQPTHLLHLAWDLEPGKYTNSVNNFRWTQSSLELLRLFHEYGGTRVVMAGSCTEYDWEYGYCSERLTPTVPMTVYGCCKNSLRMLLDGHSRISNLSWAWPRAFFLYGPHEHPKRLVSSVICSLLQGQLALCSHGEQRRDFLHVQDVADAFVQILSNSISGPINVGSGNPISIKDVVNKIAEKLGKQEMLRLGALAAGESEAPLVVADVGRLNKEVGWRPRIGWDDGLEQTIEWWKNQGLGKQV